MDYLAAFDCVPAGAYGKEVQADQADYQVLVGRDVVICLAVDRRSSFQEVAAEDEVTCQVQADAVN